MITEHQRFEKKHGSWGTVMHDQTTLFQFEEKKESDEDEN